MQRLYFCNEKLLFLIMFTKENIYFTLMLTTAVCLPFVLHDNLFHLLSEGCHLRLLIWYKQIKKIIFRFWFSHLKSNIPLQQLQNKVKKSLFLHLSSVWFYALQFLKFNKAEIENLIHLIFLHLLSHFLHVSVILCYERSHYALKEIKTNMWFEKD